MGIIYRLVFPNGKSYIGQTIFTLDKRLKEHHKPSNKCVALKHAIGKYKTYKSEVLEEVDNNLLDQRESFYIKEFNTLVPNGYNLTTGGEGGKVTEQTRQKMREAHKNRPPATKETRDAISNGLKGRSLSEETKMKIRIARLANPGTVSDDNRAKINQKIKSKEVREKGSKSKRKDNFDLPMYIQVIRKKKAPGYCVAVPGHKVKYFVSVKQSMEDKLQLAKEYLKQIEESSTTKC